MLRSLPGSLCGALFALLAACGDDGNTNGATDSATDGTATDASATDAPTTVGSSTETTGSSGSTTTSTSTSTTAATTSQTTDPETTTGTSSGTALTGSSTTDDTDSTTGDGTTTMLLSVDLGVSPPALFKLDLEGADSGVQCQLAPGLNVDGAEFVEDGSLWLHDADNDRILDVDPCSCGFQIVGASDVDALEFTVDGRGALHGAAPGLSAYVTVNPATGAASIEATLGITFDDGAVTWSEDENMLLVVDAVNNQLFRFDTETTMLSAPTTVVPDVTDPGMTTVPQTQEVFLCSGTTLYSLDTATGAATSVGATSMTGPCTTLAAPRSDLACLR